VPARRLSGVSLAAERKYVLTEPLFFPDASVNWGNTSLGGSAFVQTEIPYLFTFCLGLVAIGLSRLIRVKAPNAFAIKDELVDVDKGHSGHS
jgi:hypothetical protein